MSLKKKRRIKPVLIQVLIGAAFFANGIDCFENHLLFLGISSVVVASLNISTLCLYKKHPFATKVFLLIINAIFAALSAYSYFSRWVFGSMGPSDVFAERKKSNCSFCV